MAQEHQVYVSAHVTVSKATDSEGHSRCIRIQRFPSSEACDESYRRISIQKQLEHPNICGIYEVRKEDPKTVRTEMEWCGTSIDELHCSWTQDDCWHLLCSLSSALAYAQRLNIAHGFLLPEALYYTEEGYYKIGKFSSVGSSKEKDYLASCRQPFFMSAELKQAYARLLLGEKGKDISCNTYKSDVYTAGLILLYLLSPLSLPHFGDLEAVQLTISGLSLHSTFQQLLIQMLQADVQLRPDWTQMEETVLEIQRNFAQEAAKEAEIANKHVKRRLKVIKKPMEPKKEPELSNICMVCGVSFVLNLTDCWRLDLIGSSSSQLAAQHCSNRCFLQTPGTKAPLHHSTMADILSHSHPEIDMRELPHYGGSYLQFYHCFRHTVYSTALDHTDGPTVLAECPECPAGEVSSEVVQPLEVEIARNSLYPSLIFVKTWVQSTLIYIPIAAAFRESLVTAECHVCGGSLQPQTWVSFFHGERLDLVCCFCFQQTIGQETCPACGISREVSEEEVAILETDEYMGMEFLQGCVLLRDDAWCYLCFSRPTSWFLPCGHSFCLPCLSLQPDLTEVDSFGCMYCGYVIPKEEHQDLMLQMGRS